MEVAAHSKTRETNQQKGCVKVKMSMSVIEKVKRHIEEHDRLIELFGMEIEKVEEGRSVVSMTVGHDHLNAAGLCHGGTIFALADVAFALACNSYGVMALALEVSVNYLRPSKPGDRLTAEASEINLGKKTGLYTIKVRNQENKEIAFLKATAFRIEGESVAS